MPDPANIASLGLLAGFVQFAALGLLETILPPPPNTLGGYGRRPPKRRPQEDDEAFLFAALL